jgi:anti-sigma28 factor (negative regulator of flagellin synthesis)
MIPDPFGESTARVASALGVVMKSICARDALRKQSMPTKSLSGEKETLRIDRNLAERQARLEQIARDYLSGTYQVDALATASKIIDVSLRLEDGEGSVAKPPKLMVASEVRKLTNAPGTGSDTPPRRSRSSRRTALTAARNAPRA